MFLFRFGFYFIKIVLTQQTFPTKLSCDFIKKIIRPNCPLFDVDGTEVPKEIDQSVESLFNSKPLLSFFNSVFHNILSLEILAKSGKERRAQSKDISLEESINTHLKSHVSQVPFFSKDYNGIGT